MSKLTTKYLILCALALCAAACGGPERPSTTGTTPEVERRVDRLLSQM